MSGTRIAVVRRRTLVMGALAAILISTAIWWGVRPGGTTQVQVYNPAGFQATEVAEGSCWTGSLAAQRAGAFRCSAGNALHDPCFNTDSSVACPLGNPAKNKGVLLKLTAPLPAPPEAWTNPPDLANPVPWYMTLAGGGTCGMLTGTRPPEYPLGCALPGPPEKSVYCSLPAPLADRSGTYATVCGVWQGDGEEITGQQVYLVKDMWL